MIAKGTMFFQSLSNLRNSAIWHGEIKRKSFDLTMPNCGNSQIWEWLTKTKQCTLCRVKGKYNTKIQVFFSFQTFRVGPYGALEHKITFPKAIIDTWKRKFFLSTVCNLIHFYQKLMIWSSAMFTNPTFHFFRSAHWSHLGWKKCKKKWIKRVEEIALKSVLKSLEQNAVQWSPIFNLDFFHFLHIFKPIWGSVQIK